MGYEKISGFTDEISSHLEQQLTGAEKAGISYLALRNIDGKNICSYTPAVSYTHLDVYKRQVRTVEESLENSRIERVVFNVFKDEDLHIYKEIFGKL